MENKTYRKYFTKQAEEVDDRTLRFIGSTEDLDGDRDILKLSGWDLERFKKNPVICVNHKTTDLPVGKAVNVWKDTEKKALMFDVKFADMDEYPYADTIYKLYKGGYMKGTSVSFQPDYEKVIWGETKGEPRAIFNGQTLLELSLVTLPCNENALMTNKSIQKAMSDDIVDELEVKDLGEWLSKFTEEKDEKDSILLKKEEFSNQPIIKENKEINKCRVCNVDIDLCPTCYEIEKKKSAEKNFFEMLYGIIE